MIRKNGFALILAAALFLSLFFGVSSSAAERKHAGYSFADAERMTADEGGKYPLSLDLFQQVPDLVGGYRGNGIRGYVAFDPALFSSLEELSVGFWMNFTSDDRSTASTLFSVVGKDGQSVELALSSHGTQATLTVVLSDGTDTVSCSTDYTSYLEDPSGWNHVAFTYKKAGSVSLLTLYVNGVAVDFSTKFVDLSGMVCSAAYLTDFTVDEVYVSDRALDANRIGSLMKMTMANFYAAQQREIDAQGIESNEGSSSGEGSQPVTTDAYSYSWAAYLFEDSFAGGTDLHRNENPCTVDYNGCAVINSANFKEKFGYALIRREGVAPSSYLTLPSSLFRDQTAFTFACWVYRSGKSKPNRECLLDLNGNGVLRFAPYAVNENGAGAAFVEYTDISGSVLHRTIGDGKPADPRGTWVHYALILDGDGTLSVFINGALTATYTSGLTLSQRQFSSAAAVTGASSGSDTRTAVDEVYVAPKALSAADIRKMQFYGLQRFTSEVLPDPNPDGNGTGTDVSDPNAPDAVDIAQDAYTQRGTIAGGFIGTTFDSRAEIGADWNGSARASVTGGQLTSGVSSYGLQMDGATSFLRYPIGILDGVSALTIGVSYQWNGPTSASSRAQRLFDFSRKTSSVASPDAFLFLEMGTGFSGLRFGISDGTNATYLTCDYNETGVWNRVTVTVENGVITIYLNDVAAATGLTDVDLSAVCPNFCYIGKSGVKGDPLFCGVVDEIYISPSALPADRVGAFTQGISAALNGASVSEKDSWGTLIIVIIVVAGILVLGVVALIVVTVTRKDKQPDAVRPPEPGKISSSDRSAQSEESEASVPIGPRSVRHHQKNAAESLSQEESAAKSAGSTVSFSPVRTDEE